MLPSRIAPPALLLALAGALPGLDVDLHGFVSQGWLRSTDNDYLARDTTDGSFQFTEAALAVSSDFDRLRVSAQLLSRTLTVGEPDPRITLDYAFGDYRFAEPIGARAGRIKQPFGLYNESRDVDLGRTFVLLPQSVYPELTREYGFAVNGGALYGHLPVPRLGSFEYSAFLGATSLDDDSTAADYYSVAQSDLRDISARSIFGGQLLWNLPVEGLRLGASWRAFQDVSITGVDDTVPQAMPNNATVDFDPDWMLNHAFSLEWLHGPFTIAGEYARFRFHGPMRYRQPAVQAAADAGLMGLLREQRQDQEGWYALATWRLHPLFEAGAYYSHWRDLESVWVRDGDRQYQHDAAVALRFDPLPYWTIKAELHRIWGYGMVAWAEPVGDDEWWLATLKTTIGF